MSGSHSFTLEQLSAADRRLRTMMQPHEQLMAARQQAEGYRNFLASLTGLIGAVFVLEGRENLTDLPGWWRWAVIVLLIAGFASLIVASWLTVTAAHGPPGYTPTLDANRVLAYEVKRTRSIWRSVNWARWLALVGTLAIAMAIVLTWVAPVAQKGPHAVSRSDREAVRMGQVDPEEFAAHAEGIVSDPVPAQAVGAPPYDVQPHATVSRNGN